LQAEFLISFGRWVLPIIAFYVIVGCGVSLVRGNRKTGTIGYIVNSANGDQIPLTAYETSIGRSKACDVVLAYTTVSRFHAVIAKRGGEWFIFDTFSKTGTTVNGEKVLANSRSAPLNSGDEILFGNATFTFFENLPKNIDISTVENPALFDGDAKFHTGEIILPENITEGYKLKNCISGEEFVIDNFESILIGSRSDAHIHINSSSVSRSHALISRLNEGWIIEDLNSATGTLLNGIPVTECTPLSNDDVIEICGFTIKFIEPYT